jgi:BASS family bile acid:Na+ symporter
MNIANLIQMALTASVMLIVCSLGLKAKLRDATCLFQRPQFMRSMLAMFVIMPVIAGILAYTLSLPPAVEIAFVALSVSPVPPILPKKMLSAGGSRSYVLGLLVAAGITSILFIPVEVEVFERVFGGPAHMPAGSIARIVTTSIIVPLALGLAIQRLWPSVAEKITEPLSRFAMLLLIVSLLPVVLTQSSAAISLIGDGTLLAIAVFVAVGLIAGYLLGGSDVSDRTVLSLSTASRHPGVAMAIARTNFPSQKLVLPAILLYLIVSALLSWLFLTWLRRKDSQSSTGIRRPAA